MIGLKSVATSVKHAWAGAVLVATVLVVAGCELLGAEQSALPAAATSLPPATFTAAATAPRPSIPAARPVATPAPVASPEVPRLSRAATPVIPGWIAARATRGAGAVATVRAGVSATAQAEVSATVRAAATEAAAIATLIAAVEEQEKHHVTISMISLCLNGGGGHNYAGYEGVRWTADGAHILLTANAEVWAVTPDGTQLWRLAQGWGQARGIDGSTLVTFGSKTSFDVTWDGNQVVYATCAYPPHVPGVRLEHLDPFDFDYELAVVGLDGQAPRRLTRHRAFDNYPAWSPDGTRVAFVSGRGDRDLGIFGLVGLYTMAADGTDVRHLAPDLEGVAWQPPAWSPDGRSIAVAVKSWDLGKQGHALYVVPADGAGFARLADTVSGGAWSPDGTRLAFAKPEGAEVTLYTIAADGADARRVTTVPGWEPTVPDWEPRHGVPDPRGAWIHTVAWSPDGSKLLYSCGARQFCVVTLDGQPVSEPCPGWADGPACYTRDGEVVGTALVGDRAVWSPDGGRIAVTSRPAPRTYNGIVLYSAAPDGSDRQTLAWRGVGLVAAQAKDEDLATSRAACAAGMVVPAPDAHPGLVRDCATLLAARAALFGRLLVNWGSGSPLARWEGVTVAGSPPRVTALDLRDKDLGFSLLPARSGLVPGTPGHGGTIPAPLGDLDHLQRLDLFGNALAGPIPPELGALSHLTELSLGWNQLTGCIPVGLRRIEVNDLAELGLPDCEAGS